jgi:esterase/lipase superfamily enzyme
LGYGVSGRSENRVRKNFPRRINPGAISAALMAGVLMLSGCASVPDAIIGVDNPNIPVETVAGANKHDIFIATTRALDEDPAILYSGERGDKMGLARVTVSVPPNHVSGQTERPTSLPPNPRTDFTVLSPHNFGDDRLFVEGVNAALASRPKGDRNVLVFVHGYNTTLTAAVLRISQFVEDSGYTGVPVLFSWASRGKAIDYLYDLNSSLHARDDLLRTAKLLGQTKAEGFDILAHSMGNFLTVEAMRQLKIQGRFGSSGRLRTIILASPDIDVDVFKKQIAPFPKDERRFYILISKDDKALSFSRRIAGGVNRVGDESADDLAALGVTVIDLTKVEDSGSLNHSKFTESPEVVQLIGNRLRLGNTLQTATPGGGLVGGLAASLTAIPTALVGGGGRIVVLGQ